MSVKLPSDWSIKKLSDVADVVSGGTPSRDIADFWFPDEIEWVTPTDITRGDSRTLDFAKEKISINGLNNSSAKLLPINTVLMTSRATLGEMKVSRVACCTNQGFKSLIPKAATDVWFLYYQMKRKKPAYEALGIGSTFLEVNKKDTDSFEIEFPPFTQQQQIAKILSTVDNLIEKTQSLIDKYTAVKQGMMADLFTRGIDLTPGDNYGQLRPSATEAPDLYQQTELGWVPKDWKVTSLNNFLKNIGQGWSPDCESEVTKTGQWGVLKTTAVVWKGFDSDANKALPSSLKPRPEYEVLVGDVLMTRAGPGNRVGVVAYVKDTQSKLILSDKLYRIEPTKQIVNEYLALLLSSDAIQRQIDATKTGLAESQSNISQDIVKKLIVNLSNIEEQKLVINRVNAIAYKIEHEYSYLKKLKSQKKGLMQDLLTGKVRVN
jgi:type I restriction enzyme S subunit